MSRILGIDLGAYSVKVAVVSPGFRNHTVVDYLERPVPPGDEPHEVRAAQVLGQLMREARLDQDICYSALSGDQVFIRVLEFAFRNLRRPELFKAVGAELESILPIDLDDMVYAFEPLPRTLAGVDDGTGTDPAGPGAALEGAPGEPAFAAAPPPVSPHLGHGPVAAPTEGMRALACASMTSRVGGFLETLEKQGAEPRGLITAPASYPRVFERIAAAWTPEGTKLPPMGPTAVIDIGHERTDVCVVVGGRAVFVRTVARGGRQLTEAIARVWRLSWEQAESAKHQDGFVASATEPAQSEAWSRIHEALSPELGPLARDLRQTLLSCRAKTGATAERAVLVGGGSRLRGLASYMSEQLGIPVSVLGPAEDASILGPRLAQSGYRADVACLAAGVAFEGASGRPSFDLRQGELSFKADLSFLRAKAVPLSAAALAIIACAALTAYADLYQLKKSGRALEKRLALESTEVLGKALSASDVLDRVSPSGGSGDDSPMPKMSGYDMLLAFNKALPAKDQVKIDVQDIDIKAGSIVVRAISAPTASQDALAGIKVLESSLKKSKCYANFSNPGSQPGRDETRDFTITIKTSCNLAPGQEDQQGGE